MAPKKRGEIVTVFLSHPLMLCWACSSGKSLHPRSTCRSLAFCVRRCEPTECLTFPYRSYNPQVVMEMHWVAVAAKLQWREERAKRRRRSISPASFVSFYSLRPSLLIKRALTKGICWLQAKKAGQSTRVTRKIQSAIYQTGASLRAATLKWGQNTRVKDVRFVWLSWLCWTIQTKMNGSLLNAQSVVHLLKSRVRRVVLTWSQ